MKNFLAPLGVAAALATPALCQTELIYSIEKPAHIFHGWGDSLTNIDDVDGDGIGDLVVGVEGHAQPIGGVVYSGATGALLYQLDTPFVPLFWSDGVVVIADDSGDGISEIVLIGAHSGDANSPNGRLRVYSGADGTLLREVDVPTGTILTSHMQAGSINLGDVDADGSDDILCHGSTTGVTGITASLISSATGEVIYAVQPEGPAHILGDSFAELSDHDGDGRNDFAVPVYEAGRRRAEIRSAATGALISTMHNDALQFLSGNGEPFLGVSDLDGDGLRDLAIGSIFFGSYAGVISSANGSLLREWDCEAQNVPCLGQMVVEVDDISGDGAPDLLALETNLTSNGNQRLFGLDPSTGAIIFEELQPDLFGDYTSADRVISMPNVDPAGFPTVAMIIGFEFIEVQRIIPEIGSRGCTSTPNSSGNAAQISVYGSASRTLDSLLLEVEGAPALEPGYFVYGTQTAQLPFGNGFLCVGGQISRLAPVSMNSVGHSSHSVNLDVLDAELTHFTFQVVFRDSAVGSFHSSDAVTVELVP